MNLIARVLLLSFLLIFQSCGGHFHLSAKGCDDSTQWIVDPPPEWGGQGLIPKEVIKYDFEMKKTLFTGSKLSDRLDKFVINDLLKEENIVCRDLESLTVISKASFWENFWGLIPFVSYKTIIIKGIKKTQPADTSESKKEGDSKEDEEEQDKEEQDDEEQDDEEQSSEESADSLSEDEFEQQLKELEDKPESETEESSDEESDEESSEESEDESEEDSDGEEDSEDEEDSEASETDDFQSPDEEDSEDEIELDSFED